jgi:curved DNA-binding protein CbpA
MGVEPVDHYEVLGVGRDADAETIKSAWRYQARRHHPDLAKRRGAPQRFIRIREAYEVLSDAERRRRYDAWLERVSPSPRQPTPVPPRPRRSRSSAGAGVRQRGFRLDVLGIVHLGASLGFGASRTPSDPRPKRGPA